MKNLFGAAVAALLSIGLVIGIVAAWITHIVTCIAAQAWILLVLGALFAPVGVIHGIMVWFGVPAV